jgi:hypothetical protein
MKALGQSILLLAIIVVIGYAIGELIVYLRYRETLGMFPRYVTDMHYGDYQIRGNVPNARYRHKTLDGSWTFAINRNGFRDTTDYEYEKPEGVLRVLVLGDSFTIGYEVGQDETYSSVLSRFFEKHGVRAEVLNAGMSGNSTAEALVYLENEGFKYEPDVVVLGFYWNDLEDNVKSDLFRLEDGEITVHKKVYLPAIRARNLLNSFWPYRFLSEHSYLHNYLNVMATRHFKRARFRERLETVREDQGAEGNYEETLGRALVARMRTFANEHGADFILLDIANVDVEPSFPMRGAADASALADRYVNSADFLKQYDGIADLRRPHGHRHWSPLAHLAAGIELGNVILDRVERDEPPGPGGP